MKFEVIKKDGNARRGVLTTAHSVIQTPVFMPVGTVGAVKSLDAFDMSEIFRRKDNLSKHLPHVSAPWQQGRA